MVTADRASRLRIGGDGCFSRSDLYQLPRFESWEETKHLGHQGAGVKQADALGLKDDHGNGKSG